MSAEDLSRFQNLTYEKFRLLASDANLSMYEKIGFPDSYRRTHEIRIFEDICRKLTNLDDHGKTFVDIGPGVSDLPRALIVHCLTHGHHLHLVDSPEMLSHLPDGALLSKHPGRFPQELRAFLREYAGRIDGILSYSVLHYIFTESNFYAFVDGLLELLAPHGRLLLGDIPNVSKRRRFFKSARGIRYHQQFTGTEEVPAVDFNVLNSGQIDDSVLLGLIARCRSAGFDAYIVPQDENLPMANRREDILVVRP